jgi:DNA polymerase III delta prime subunit
MNPKTTHHAMLFVHEDRKNLAAKLWNDLSQQSPAHVFFNQTVLDTETARLVITFANTPYSREKIALISFHTITLPAQNALLKVLEEPRPGVSFILVTSNKEAIIPTLYSRLQEQSTPKNNTENSLPSEFLATKNSMRMKLPGIIALLNATDEEARKDREGVRKFILNLGEVLGEKNINSAHLLTTIECVSYASDPSASNKAILEYLSLLLPQSS